MKKLALLFSFLLLLTSLTSCGKSPEKIKAANVEKQVEANAELMKSVGRLMIVPSEDPIIATINEAELLRKEQPFYNGVENGDYLIVFPKAQKAIIYSPTKKVIVNSGPFKIDDTPKETTKK